MRYLNDYRIGDTVDLGSDALTRDEIEQFSLRYDPQPQFLDDSIAIPLHGDRVASTMQSAALAQSLLATGLLNVTAHHGVVRINDMSGTSLLRADQTVRGELSILDIREPEHGSDRGELDAEVTLYNSNDQSVMRFVASVMVARKPRR